MKIVLATPLYPPEIGGPATYSEILVAGLPKQGVTVELVKFSDVRHLPKLVRHYAYFRRVLKAARAADLVMALDPVSVGLPAFWAARQARKPFVVKIVGDYAWEQGKQRCGVTQDLDEFVRTSHVPFLVRLLRRIQTRVAHGAVRVVVPSEYLKKIVMAWGIDERAITVIYNAVTVEHLGSAPASVEKLARPWVVTAGRLVSWKRVDGVITAVSSVPGLRLVVVGDGPERALLEEQARPLGERVVFTGQLGHEDLLATLKAADAVVLNSSYEGLSHLLVESVLLGVPIIATHAGGNSEVVRDGVNGVLVPVGDTGALAHALADLPTARQVDDPRFMKNTMLTQIGELLKAT